jgi:hypothetical protein
MRRRIIFYSIYHEPRKIKNPLNSAKELYHIISHNTGDELNTVIIFLMESGVSLFDSTSRSKLDSTKNYGGPRNFQGRAKANFQ